jgi:hypothetical protein
MRISCALRGTDGCENVFPGKARQVRMDLVRVGFTGESGSAENDFDARRVRTADHLRKSLICFVCREPYANR